jgi:L-threonylcarbamoyladenylate synthase
MAKKMNRALLGSSLDRAVACIRKGGIVAFPTETYYGLAVDPYSLAAVKRLFQVKRRQADKPLLLLIENISQLQTIAENIPPEFEPLIEKYWPGPLTLVFLARKEVYHQLTGNSGTIGVRVSSHPIAIELVRRLGKPITATSANISGHRPASTAEEVLAIFGNSLSYIIDGGPTAGGLCSTVLGILEGKCTVLRQGQINLSAELRQESRCLTRSVTHHS